MSSWATKQKLRVKMLKPSGVTLTPKESEHLADSKEEDLRVIEGNLEELEDARISTSTYDMKKNMEKVEGALSMAKGVYKRTKNPIKKREWARRIVVANNTRQTLKDTVARVEQARERFEAIAQDMEMEKMRAEAQIKEARLYAKAGKYLNLKGEELLSARSSAKNLKVEYKNLEVTMEGAEQLLVDDDFTQEADKIVGRGGLDE